MSTSSAMPPSTPAYLAIKHRLRLRLGRQWRVGDRLPPMKELARVLDAGQSNTHRAVRELVREGLLISRQRSGTFVARAPKYVASLTPTELPAIDLKDHSVCILAATSVDNFLVEMVDAFVDAMSPTGITIERIIPVVHNNVTQYDFPEDADAIVAFNPPSTKSLRCLRPEQILTVVSTVGRVAVDMPGRYDVVTVDEHHGGSLAGQLLRDAGCREICFIGRGLNGAEGRFDATSAARLYGFEATWGEPLSGEHLLFSPGYSPVAGAKVFRRFSTTGGRPDGFFVASDDIAIGFISAALGSGLTAGKDFQIVGFDGQDRGRHMGDMVLTSIRVPTAKMGRRAAQLLIERFSEPDRPVHRLQLECSVQAGTTTRNTEKEIGS